jgi:hypothetical protein
MSATRHHSFSSFWPYYLQEHSRPATRWVHFLGSTLGLGILINAVATGAWATAPLALVSGYAFAWFSHFFIEKNRPATFTYPLWSFAGDWKMWAFMLSGRLTPELERLGITPKA